MRNRKLLPRRVDYFQFIYRRRLLFFYRSRSSPERKDRFFFAPLPIRRFLRGYKVIPARARVTRSTTIPSSIPPPRTGCQRASNGWVVSVADERTDVLINAVLRISGYQNRGEKKTHGKRCYNDRRRRRATFTAAHATDPLCSGNGSVELGDVITNRVQITPPNEIFYHGQTDVTGRRNFHTIRFVFDGKQVVNISMQNETRCFWRTINAAL